MMRNLNIRKIAKKFIYHPIRLENFNFVFKKTLNIGLKFNKSIMDIKFGSNGKNPTKLIIII